MSRIGRRFEALRAAGGKGFIPYLTAGDPSLDATYDLVLALEAAGADVIELGVPFSDPIADGPVIQRATDRALAHGVKLGAILELVRRIRRVSEIPLLLMSYYNPLLRRGLVRLAGEAADAGLDGILASDLTVEESGPFVEALRGAGLDAIFLAAPTSPPDRIRRIAETSTGFLYAVSRTGVTGTADALPPELVDFIRQLRRCTATPIAVGFGISRPEHVRAVWAEADAAIVGSAIVQEIERRAGQADLAAGVAGFVRWLRGAESTVHSPGH